MNSPIDDIIKRFRLAITLVENQNGQIIDLAKKKTFTKGHFLHQATDKMSEKESSDFELKYPEVLNFLRDFDDQLRRLF